ncbi:ABC transporter permease subunit [Paenibacillus sp. P25]|nr:ABC transporter permease subunit [Paenibacillus sp. P25]
MLHGRVCAAAQGRGRASSVINFLILTGLMIPPAIVPTIWVLNGIGLFKTMTGLTLVEVALHFPFAAILYKAFMATIPRELDESAFIDGCSGVAPLFQYRVSAAEAGDLDDHCAHRGQHFQRFCQSALFFAGGGQCDGAADALQFYEPL